MSRLNTLAGAVLIALLSGITGSSAALSEPVRTTGGLLSGVPGADPGVRVFKGMPFAAPPVGDLRWRPPQPPAKWDGVRVADHFSNNCMQRRADGGAFPPYGGDRSATTMSEDCLYLNVYTAAASANAKLPVMVWIHGGALTQRRGRDLPGRGPGARRASSSSRINYRLGVFGFLAHPELTAGVAAPLVGQLRAARSDRRAQVGADEHRGLRRRSVARHDLRRVGRLVERPQPGRVAAGQGAVPPRDRRERRSASRSRRR